MDPTLLQVLIQVPLVGAFILYSLEMNKRMVEAQKAFMEALDKRETAFNERNQALIGAIEAMNHAICASVETLEKDHSEHDKFVRERLSVRSAH